MRAIAGALLGWLPVVARLPCLIVVGNENSALGDGLVGALEESPPVHEVRHVEVLVTVVTPTHHAVLKATDYLVEGVATVVVEVDVVASGRKTQDSLIRGCRGQLDAAALGHVRAPDLRGVLSPCEGGFGHLPFAREATRPAVVCSGKDTHTLRLELCLMSAGAGTGAVARIGDEASGASRA